MSSLRKLLSDAMKGNWSEVFETYKQDRALRTTQIAGTGDTVLHMAVSSGKENVVANIVDLLVREGNVNTLGAENNRKNTPLHFAAKMGNVEICKKISDTRPYLIDRRNIAGETPLFLSALNGRKKAFLWLHHKYTQSLGASSTNFAHCMRDNEDTILHCTIAEEHIDVAIQIIHLYKDHLKEMVRRNKEGSSPLHILASKRFCFKSSADYQPSFLGSFALTLTDRIRRRKVRHMAIHIMNELLRLASVEDMSPKLETESGIITIDTPLMIAAKNDVVEMVEKILELFPSTVKDVNAEGKNILLLAADYRAEKVFRFLCKQKWLSDYLFAQVDNEGNNALHLAAKLGIEHDWLIPGKSLSMIMEMRWFKFVEDSMPCGFSARYNTKMEAPMHIFRERHKEMVKSEGEWVSKVSQACSVVSTVVVSVAFATRTSVPGGYDENSKGYAILRDNAVFKIFEGSSLVALFLSLISTVFLLSVVVSPYQSFESWLQTPYALYVGMSSMLASIVCLWISFCAADFFILDDHTQKLHNPFQTYIVLSSLIILYAGSLIPTFLGPIYLTMSRIRVPSSRKFFSDLVLVWNSLFLDNKCL